jgi:hypothetical protein
MTDHQSHIVIRRFNRLQQWEEWNWRGINLVVLIVIVVKAIYHYPAWYLWLPLVCILLAGPKLYRQYQKKKHALLESNIVKLPPDWDQRISIFTRLAGWRFILLLFFGITNLLSGLWMYVILGLLYLCSWLIDWLAWRKQKEVTHYIESYQPHESTA